MKIGHARIVAALTVALAIGLPVGAFAGGDIDDHVENDPGGGPSYYGFVKDHRGVLVPEAKVTAEIKGRGSIYTHTNVLGAYRINSFGKEINPNDIAITCSKDGYRQIRVTQREESRDGKTAIEIECTLRRL